MPYQDKQINCRDCGGQFVFTAGEQEFYASKGFTNEPTRCPLQRRMRKQGENSYNSRRDGPCEHDVTRSGSSRSSAPRGGYDRGERSFDRPRRERSAYQGPLPSGPIAATVVRVDPAGRYLFVRVDQPAMDVYVHGSLLPSRGPQIREGDSVEITVGPSERGPRALSCDLA